MRYLAALLIMLAGLGVVWVSYHADELGFGKYPGVGEKHFILTFMGVCISGGGLLLLLAPRRKQGSTFAGPRGSPRIPSGRRPPRAR